MNLKLLFKNIKGKKAQDLDKKQRHKRDKERKEAPKEILDDLEELESEKDSTDIKKLENEYETIEGKSCKDEAGEYTKEYIEWKLIRAKFNYLLDLGARLVEEELESPKNKRERQQDRIRKIAFQIANLFPTSHIIRAISGEGGFAVHGWIQDNCDDYEWLIENWVLDRAVLYSKRVYKPEVFKAVKNLDLSELKATKVELFEPAEFENYPNLPFRQVIIFHTSDLEEGLTWISNYPYWIDGYEVRVNFAPANLGQLGFCLWNIPVAIVLHAVGKSYGMYDAKMKAEDLTDMMDDIKAKIIHQYRTSIKPMEDKLDEVYRDSMLSEQKYILLKKKIETKIPMDIEDEYEKLEKQVRRKNIGWDWKNIALIIVIFIIAGLIIWLFLSLGSERFPNNSTISSTGIFESKLINLLNLYRFII